jgi:hypothetical protein
LIFVFSNRPPVSSSLTLKIALFSVLAAILGESRRKREVVNLIVAKKKLKISKKTLAFGGRRL